MNEFTPARRGRSPRQGHSMASVMALSAIEVASLVEHCKRREVIEACDPLRYVPRY